MDDPRQKRIYAGLLRLGPGPSAFYLDACELILGKSKLKSTTHLISHLLREIESSLRDGLEVLLRKKGLRRPEKNTEQQHKNDILVTLEALEIPKEHPIALLWLKLAGQDGLAAKAHRKNLDDPRPIDAEFLSAWEEMQTVLDFVLSKFENRFLESFPLLEELASINNPTKADLKKFTQRVPKNEITYGHFFGKLQYPSWINPLKKRDVFQKPTTPIREGEYISFPIWPQALYLSRMANIASKEVLEVILQVPFSENIRVHEDFADAALAMPPDLSAKWAQHELEWIKKQSWLYFRFPEKLSELILHLINGNQIKVAFNLFKRLFLLKPEKKTSRKKHDFISPKPSALMSIHEYERALTKVMSELIKKDSRKTFEIFSGLLAKAVLFSSRHNIKKSGDDHSYIWRSKVEYTTRHYSDFKELWVSALRYVCEETIKSDPAKAKIIINNLLKRKPALQIFKRIAFYLLGKFPDLAPDIFEEQLPKREYLGQVWCQDEYEPLLKSGFKKLNPKNQKKILSWIEKGPSKVAIKNNPTRISGKKPSKKQINYHFNKWQLECLQPISQDLPPAWQRRYHLLVKKFGVPSQKDREIYTRSWSGPESPKDKKELEEMSIAELVTYLRNWEPPKEPFAPSMEGLGRTLKEVIVANPQRYATEAEKFIGLDPTYVSPVFSAFQQVAMNQGAFKWDNLIELAHWVISQPLSAPLGAEEVIEGRDLGWQWTRQTIIRLIEAGLHEGPSKIPHSLSDQIWRIIKPLTSEVDLTPEIENEDLTRGRQAEALVLSYTRPQAIRATILYGAWSYSYKKGRSFSLNSIPELREILEAHLDLSSEPSLIVHSVYGALFPCLAHLDKEWATLNKHKIFSRENPDFFNAAWHSFINSNRPYKAAFELLKDEYKYALAILSTCDPSDSLKAYEHSLTECLMVFYWLGWIDYEDPEGILNLFYQHASDDLKEHAIHFVGRSLFDEEAQWPEESLKRLKTFWEFRLQTVLPHATKPNIAKELTSFGWWFLSSRFDQEWSVQNLLKVLEISGKVDGAHLVLEKLLSIMEKYPAQVLQCLTYMIEGAKKDWDILGWRKEMRAILSIAVTHPDPQIKNEGINCVNRLGAKRHTEYYDLLPKTA